MEGFVNLLSQPTQDSFCFQAFYRILFFCPRLVIFNLYLIPMYYPTLIGHACDSGALTGQFSRVVARIKV
jgi:hypothetical protein